MRAGVRDIPFFFLWPYTFFFLFFFFIYFFPYFFSAGLPLFHFFGRKKHETIVSQQEHEHGRVLVQMKM